jgi:hypothetical protein
MTTATIALSAMRNVAAASAARDALDRIATGTGRPDELAKHLLILLDQVGDAHRADVIKGFMRPLEKRIEAQFSKVQGAD